MPPISQMELLRETVIQGLEVTRHTLDKLDEKLQLYIIEYERIKTELEFIKTQLKQIKDIVSDGVNGQPSMVTQFALLKQNQEILSKDIKDLDSDFSKKLGLSNIEIKSLSEEFSKSIDKKQSLWVEKIKGRYGTLVSIITGIFIVLGIVIKWYLEK